MNSHFSSSCSNTMTKAGIARNLAYSSLTFCRNIVKCFLHCNNRSDQKNKQMTLDFKICVFNNKIVHHVLSDPGSTVAITLVFKHKPNLKINRYV